MSPPLSTSIDKAIVHSIVSLLKYHMQSLFLALGVESEILDATMKTFEELRMLVDEC